MVFVKKTYFAVGIQLSELPKAVSLKLSKIAALFPRGPCNTTDIAMSVFIHNGSQPDERLTSVVMGTKGIKLITYYFLSVLPAHMCGGSDAGSFKVCERGLRRGLTRANTRTHSLSWTSALHSTDYWIFLYKCEAQVTPCAFCWF